MAGKPQFDYAAICADYRAGMSQGDIALKHRTTKATVVRAVARIIPSRERADLRSLRNRAGAALKSAKSQAAKIARGDFVIREIEGAVQVLAKGVSFTFDAVDGGLLRTHAWQVTKDNRLLRQMACPLTGRRLNIYVYHDILGITPSRKRVVDHINRDPTDNRRANLRVCSASENCMNRVQRGGHPPRLTSGREHFCA